MKYFTYCPEDGIGFFDTADDARKAADALLDKHIDWACDGGWHEQADEICWGKVTHITERHNITRREDDPENWIHGDDCDEAWDRRWVPVEGDKT